MMRDTKARSVAKSLVWRVAGIFLLGGIAYMITGNWIEMGIITATFHGIRVVAYYYHERGWEMVSWGKLDTGTGSAVKRISNGGNQS